jgi:hypothetical protein
MSGLFIARFIIIFNVSHCGMRHTVNSLNHSQCDYKLLESLMMFLLMANCIWGWINS